MDLIVWLQTRQSQEEQRGDGRDGDAALELHGAALALAGGGGGGDEVDLGGGSTVTAWLSSDRSEISERIQNVLKTRQCRKLNFTIETLCYDGEETGSFASAYSWEEWRDWRAASPGNDYTSRQYQPSYVHCVRSILCRKACATILRKWRCR